MPMIRCAPIFRQSAPVASPTGPRPVISTASFAADSDLLQAFVDGAEAAGHLRAVGVGQLIRKRDQVLLFGEQVIRHAAVALPAVSAAILRAGAGDHVAAPAVVADAAAGDVIDDHAIAGAEPAAARPGLRRSGRRFMSGDHALVALRTLAQMLVINAADIGPQMVEAFMRSRTSPWPGSGPETSRSSTVLLPGR